MGDKLDGPCSKPDGLVRLLCLAIEGWDMLGFMALDYIVRLEWNVFCDDPFVELLRSPLNSVRSL